MVNNAKPSPYNKYPHEDDRDDRLPGEPIQNIPGDSFDGFVVTA